MVKYVRTPSSAFALFGSEIYGWAGGVTEAPEEPPKPRRKQPVPKPKKLILGKSVVRKGVEV